MAVESSTGIGSATSHVGTGSIQTDVTADDNRRTNRENDGDQNVGGATSVDGAAGDESGVGDNVGVDDSVGADDGSDNLRRPIEVRQTGENSLVYNSMIDVSVCSHTVDGAAEVGGVPGDTGGAGDDGGVGDSVGTSDGLAIFVGRQRLGRQARLPLYIIV